MRTPYGREPICLQNHLTRGSKSLIRTSGDCCSSERTDRFQTAKVSVFLSIGRAFDILLVIYKDAHTSRTYDYAQVKSTAIDFGKGLKGTWEWKTGEVMGLFTPNSIDTPAVIWGTHWAGGIISPANPGYTTDELAFQLKDSGAKALCTQKPFLKTALEAAKQAGIPENRIILIGDEKDESGQFKHFSSIRNIAGTNRYRRTKAKPKDDLAFLVYSSGTTGHPKGVMLSHENIVANILMLKAGEGGNLTWDGGPDGGGDNILAFLPFFHIYGRFHFIPRLHITLLIKSQASHAKYIKPCTAA